MCVDLGKPAPHGVHTYLLVVYVVSFLINGALHQWGDDHLINKPAVLMTHSNKVWVPV